VYDSLTENYGVMVIVKRDAGRELSDKIFHYKAQSEQLKMIGCKQMVRFHKKNYDRSWLDRSFQQTFDINSFLKRKSNSFSVEKV
jgi:hypothetical protein